MADMLSSKEIRQKYLDFFKERGHAIIPSASLIPENDSSLLFVNSGMFPLVPYLLGEKHPGGKRLADSQKSFRTEDIDEVGDNRHTTFFEMLGNWSLGDYFKKEQLNWWYEFLINELKFDINRMYQTVYVGNELIEKDVESVEILKEIFEKYDIKAEEGAETKGNGNLGPGVEIDFNKYRIFAYRDKNWWQRGDAIGELGGPDSETFYDTGKKHNEKFGEYCHLNCDCGRFIEIGNSVFMQYQKTEIGWEQLKNKNVDFGGGLERITMFVQEKDNVFETDLFLSIIQKIEELSGKKYRDDEKSFERIADHLKAATFIIGDERGIGPSNIGQGYIVRRLIRRALRYGRQLGIKKESWIKDVAGIVRDIYINIYPELDNNFKFVSDEIAEEEKRFQKSLDWLEQYRLDLINARDNKVTKEIKGIPILNISGVASSAYVYENYHTYGVPPDLSEGIIKELGLKFDKDEFDRLFKEHQELSRTASAGMFKGGLADSSEQTTKYHTATHLLNAALRNILGGHIHQKGSNITAERLRFDFSHPDKLTSEQIKQVEDWVNEQIKKDLPVYFEETTLDEAKKIGAEGVFESKYGDKVKVYFIGKGDENVSKEICGGPHVTHTGELGAFKIQKEESSSAGVRRIKAVLE